MPEQHLTPRSPLLVVDDDPFELSTVQAVLESAGITNVTLCSDSRQARSLLERDSFSLVILDVTMPYLSGPELLPIVLEFQPDATIVFVSAKNDVSMAVELLRNGAHDYLTKPFDADRLLATVRSSLDRWQVLQENQRMRDGLLSGAPAHPEFFEPIVTRSPRMIQIFCYIESIAPTDLPVLLLGDTGVGKELLAEAVHRASGKRGPFVPVNVAGLDDVLFSDTLFGHVKGAFTGAAASRPGLLRRASGGTLFLDEVGDLAPESQIKLLRLLQNHEYYPLGSDHRETSDARLVLATNQDLEHRVREGAFRRDLYYRLSSHRINVPSLKDRPEDLRPLTDAFLAAAARTLGRAVPSVAPSFYAALQRLPFAGNVRELEGLVAEILVRNGGESLTVASLPPHLEMTTGPERPDVDWPSWTTLPTLAEVTAGLTEEALRRSRGNQGVAARLLGISRTALNKRLNKASAPRTKPATE